VTNEQRRTRRPVPSDFDKGVVYPPGTMLTLIEPLAAGVWVAEVRIADESLVGGARYDTVTVQDGDLETTDR
jgi:hypothetical protein